MRLVLTRAASGRRATPEERSQMPGLAGPDRNLDGARSASTRGTTAQCDGNSGHTVHLQETGVLATGPSTRSSRGRGPYTGPALHLTPGRRDAERGAQGGQLLDLLRKAGNLYFYVQSPDF